MGHCVLYLNCKRTYESSIHTHTTLKVLYWWLIQESEGLWGQSLHFTPEHSKHGKCEGRGRRGCSWQLAKGHVTDILLQAVTKVSSDYQPLTELAFIPWPFLPLNHLTLTHAYTLLSITLSTSEEMAKKWQQRVSADWGGRGENCESERQNRIHNYVREIKT